MSKTPPRRGEKPPAPGGARRTASSATPPKTKSASPTSSRQARTYEYDDQYHDDRYDDRYDRYPPPPRSRRPPQSSTRPGAPAPTRRPPPPRYVAPRRDAFPIVMGALVGMMVVGLLIVVYLLLSQKNGTVPTAAAVNNNTTSAAPTMAQSSNNSASVSETLAAKRPAEGIGTAVPDEGNAHVADGEAISYQTYPPATGTHYSTTADYGFSDAEIAEGYFVHSLEHGAIVLYYKPDVSDTIKQELKDTYNKLPAGKYGKVKLVIVPYTKMSTPLAIAAWDRLLLLNDYNFDEIQTFYNAWVDKGPEDVP